MSIEYTIDVQLTELGFPDILQLEETSGRETARRSSEQSFSPTHTTRKQRSLLATDDKKAGAAKQNSVNHSPAGPEQQDTAQEDSTETPQDVEEDSDGDSDDSAVSEVYEEEEVDEEDDEEEEGLNNESSISGDFRCSVCDLQLPSEFKLQDHMNLHTKVRPYRCAECGKRFCQIYNYRIHLRTHAQTKVDPLRCRVCRKSFSSQEDLKLHLSRTHFEKEFYECDLCKRVFIDLKACENHVLLHKCMMSVVCEACGRNFSSEKCLSRHKKKACHSSLKCTDCPRIFTKKNALLKHSFSHLGLLPYTCVRCRCHFRLAKLYRQHQCEPERINCVACLREFYNREDFDQHKKDTGCWGNQEPKGDEIRCLECGQRFDTSEELKKHAGAHQRVLKCAECGKGFRSALLLMSHMGGHAGKSPCLCQSCGLGFPHQQSYDSHLKTCGQAPQPVSAPKKRQASKSSSFERKNLKQTAKPHSSNPTSTDARPAVVLNQPVEPVKDSYSPGLVTGSASAASPDGQWKLTLDKQPPPGVKLVLFLPICPTEADGPTLPSAVSQTLQVPAVRVQTQAPLLHVSNEHLTVNAALGASQSCPLNLVTTMKQEPEWEAPLDLSKKSQSSKSALSDVPPLPFKSEPEECEISGEAQRQAFQNTIVKGETDTHTEEKQFKMDPMDQSPPNTAPSGLITDIKKEPLSPGPHSDSLSSRPVQLKEEVKMEVDVSIPTDTDLQK